jgi:hypothetical protein
MLNKYILNYINSLKKEYIKLSTKKDTIVCQNCKNSKVIIVKDGKNYEYTYDENGKQTLEIK